MAGSPVLTQKNGKRMKNGKPLPSSSFALPGGGPDGDDAYPIDTPGRARNALSRIAQNGTPEQRAKVKRAVVNRYKSIQVGGMQNHSNTYGRRLDFADGELRPAPSQEGTHLTCPRCGYSSDSANFALDGSSGTSASRQPEELRTPAPGTGYVRNGAATEVRTGPGGAGLSRRTRGGIELARRLPVTSPQDLVVSRVTGGAVVRHRRGGNEIATLRRNGDGSWQAGVDGQDLRPHSFQAAALREALGVYNAGTATPERAAMPLASPPRQPELLSQLGVANIRAVAGDGGDGGDDGDGDEDGGSSGGLNPKGQAIYKKLIGKGMSPKVAKAMAMRAQNTKPGQFGKAG